MTLKKVKTKTPWKHITEWIQSRLLIKMILTWNSTQKIFPCHSMTQNKSILKNKKGQEALGIVNYKVINKQDVAVVATA
jgi:hypothetical protein